MELYTAKVEDGAMIEAPIYQQHARGKNWMAIIGADPSAPGGLAREFVPRGRGRYYYIVDASLVGKPIEIAADYTSGSGNRSPKRWYGVIRGLTDSEIAIERFETSTMAIKASKERPEATPLEDERARLVARIAEIDGILGTQEHTN